MTTIPETVVRIARRLPDRQALAVADELCDTVAAAV